MSESPNVENTIMPPVEALLDAEGNAITGDGKWYKIMLADGTELGYTTTTSFPHTLHCGPRPAGQGAFFRYYAETGQPLVWNADKKGMWKAMAMGADGRFYKGFIGLASTNPTALRFSEKESDVHGLVAWRAHGNRVLLGVVPPDEQYFTGLRVRYAPASGAPGGLEIHSTHNMPMAPLDCQFVHCGPTPGREWRF